MTSKLFFTALFIVSFSCKAVAQLTEEQRSARDRGLILYQQSDWYDSQPLLEVAARAGDSSAQYYLGEAIRKSKRYTTAEAKKWYEAAAEQGDLYAMLRLSNKNDLCNNMGTCTETSAETWRTQALKIAHERAEKGDTEAMKVLFIARQGLGWLEKAAEAGDSYAQQLLASAYKDGQGWFLTPGSREQLVKKWLKASAEGGNAKSMFLYANFLYEKDGNIEGAGYWLKTSAEHGYITSVSNYARSLAHLPDNLGYPIDLIKAYGLTYLLSKLEGGGPASENGLRNLSKIAKTMTPKEIENGIAFASSWKKTHPPLSYFEPIYGY